MYLLEVVHGPKEVLEMGEGMPKGQAKNYRQGGLPGSSGSSLTVELQSCYIHG